MRHEPEESAEERAFLEALGKLPASEPPADQRQRFRQRAEATRKPTMSPKHWVVWALAASLLLVVGAGWWFDHQHQRAEVLQARTALTLALKDLSAATRLQAVRTAGVSSVRDQGIVEALTQALLSDPSTNVRVAAAEALGQVANPSTFSIAAKQSIAQEGSPFVHAALMHTSEKLNRASRDQILTLLLARPNLDPAIRAEAEATLKP